MTNDIIVVKGLVKNYKNVKAVKDITFSVKEGELFAFLGENGAGKSTTINILCQVLNKTSGKVIIDGFDIDKDGLEVKKRIGIVFQGTVLDNILTVKENLISRCAYYGMNHKMAINRVNELVKLLSLEKLLKRKYQTLSGGERRRVAIAGILALKPEILVLDEPTAGLDPQGSKEMLSLFQEFNKNGTTIILVTHDMNIVFEYADDVIVMNEGRIVKHCSPKELFLENVEQYSLDTPLISKFIQALEANGMKIDLSKVRSLDDLVNEIAKEKKRWKALR